MKLLSTTEGVHYGILSEQSEKPAPTLFVLAMDIERTLSDRHFCEIAHHLSDAGVMAVSLSLPCHGEDQREGEPHGPAAGLRGWRRRLQGGEDLVRGFTDRVSHVLDQLVEQGHTDPERVAACGTSRGGFLSLHLASREPRIRSVAAFSPVVDLRDLQEFAGFEGHPALSALDLRHRAAALADRGVWIAIGNRDERVNTDSSVDLARKIATSRPPGPGTADISLHVLPSEGHGVPAGAHLSAANWLRERLGLD